MVMLPFLDGRLVGPFLWDDQFPQLGQKKKNLDDKITRKVTLVESSIHGPGITEEIREDGTSTFSIDFTGLPCDPMTLELIEKYRIIIQQMQESTKCIPGAEWYRDLSKRLREHTGNPIAIIALDSYQTFKETTTVTHHEEIDANKAALKTKLVPVYREESKEFFITHPGYGTLPDFEKVEGHEIPTGFLRIGAHFDLLGISQTEELIDLGLVDPTDALDPAISIRSILLQNKLDTNHCQVINFTSEEASLASAFVYAIQGNFRTLQLNYEDPSYGFRLMGSINLELGDIMVDTDSDKSPNWRPIGYKLNVSRTNNNRRPKEEIQESSAIGNVAKERVPDSKIVPIRRDETKHLFVDPGPLRMDYEFVQIGGETVETGFLVFGATIGLLGVSFADILCAKGILDITDIIDPAISIESILLKEMNSGATRVLHTLLIDPKQPERFNHVLGTKNRLLKLNYASSEGFTLSGEIDLSTDINTVRIDATVGPQSSWIPIGYKLNANRWNHHRQPTQKDNKTVAQPPKTFQQLFGNIPNTDEYVVRRNNSLVVKDVAANKRGHFYTLEHDHVLISSLIFQNGPVPENGVNGWQNEEVIAALIHRIDVLNQQFPCNENVIAGRHLIAALHALEAPTRNRQARGVEGKHEK